MEQIRLPRPLGMTQALQEYHKTQDPEKLDKIQSYFIQNWIMNNQVLSGRIFNVIELSTFLKCDPDRIRLHMRDTLLSTKLWDKEKQDDLINALIGQQVTWALEDRMAVEGQVRLLQKSQGQQYTPFVSSEVNKALGMKIQTTANLGSILRGLTGSGSINIFNQQNNTEVTQSITMEQAIQIVGDENAKLTGKNADLQYIEAHYDPELLPEVVATKQLGVDTSKEGLQIGVGELNKAADGYKAILASSDNDHHDMRREIELQVDPDEDDPDMAIYPQ